MADLTTRSSLTKTPPACILRRCAGQTAQPARSAAAQLALRRLAASPWGRAGITAKTAGRKFTALVGTVYERSHIPLTKWLLVTHLLCSSKKGMSSHQIMRMTGLTYKSAWFMTHRIREALAERGPLPQMGGEGGIVEIDETFIGKKADVPVRAGYAHKHAVMSLVERRPAGAVVRSFHVSGTAAAIFSRSLRFTSRPLPT